MILHFSRQGAHSAAISSMFVWEGVMLNGNPDHYSAVLRAWGRGCLELSVECATVGVLLGEICDKFGESDVFDFPGVFDYEVSTAVGEFIAENLIGTGYFPNDDEIFAEVRKQVTEFFTKYEGTTDREREECQRILNSVMKEYE